MSNYTALGALPSTSTGVALSPDGTRAYQYVSGTTAHVYDLTVSGFPEIGTGMALPGDPGANPVMTVSPDGGTVFIAGSDSIVVVPAPLRLNPFNLFGRDELQREYGAALSIPRSERADIQHDSSAGGQGTRPGLIWRPARAST